LVELYSFLEIAKGLMTIHYLKIWNKIQLNKNFHCFVVLFLSEASVFFGSQIAISSDVASSINGSRSRELWIVTEYFIDEEKFFYLILLHMNAAFFIGILSLIAIGTFMIAYVQHTCGMFRIAWYELERNNKDKNLLKQYLSI